MNEVRAMLNRDRFFPKEPSTLRLARELYEKVRDLPIVSPHGHVDARLFSDPLATFGTPAELFIIPDHYVTRMLYSQGIPLDSLGILHGDGKDSAAEDRKIWKVFCENFHLFRATPSGIWLTEELVDVFGIEERPSGISADRLYDLIAEKLGQAEFRPRALFERFKIEVLCTTDAATDSLDDHKTIRNSNWKGRILPTFRPDDVIHIDSPDWNNKIEELSIVSGIDVVNHASFLLALEKRREYFKEMGAVATDQDVLTPATLEMTASKAEALFQHALKGRAESTDAAEFSAHMVMEMARMSCEDGLVMQVHCGSLRNHNTPLIQEYPGYGGADIPVQTEFTRNLRPLLNKYGGNSHLRLILFTLDESCYSRELAPLAGHYPAVRIGPPWWFHDSLNGMKRYFEQVMETAGIYNTAGFNDDTRGFCSIPARHDVWRRASASWVADLAARHIIALDEAQEMMQDLAVGLAREAYRLSK
jgi:glucuronate isomerase